MKLHDALFNWLQIKVVADARPDDIPAKDTYDFFTQILEEDHKVKIEQVEATDEMYTVRYLHEGKNKVQTFDRESVDYLLQSIESEPKYNQ